LANVGIDAEKIHTLDRFGARLKKLETAWQRARRGVRLTTGERELLTEAGALDTKLLSGGRWACRKYEAAQAELSRIAEGAGLSDTTQDLRHLVAFWRERKAKLSRTKFTKKDLARAVELADALEPAAAKEEDDAAAAEALELRNRCFWAGDEVAKEIREGGRYAFDTQPIIAAKLSRDIGPPSSAVPGAMRKRRSLRRRRRTAPEQSKPRALHPRGRSLHSAADPFRSIRSCPRLRHGTSRIEAAIVHSRAT
jgi:hypothetical protein